MTSTDPLDTASTTLRTVPRPPSRLGWVVLVAAALGPVLFLAGTALTPGDLPSDAAGAFAAMALEREQVFWWRLLSGLGSVLFVLLCAPLVRLVPRGARGAVLLRVGLVLLVEGGAANGLSHVVQGYATAAATDPSVPPDAGLAVWRRVGEDHGLLLGYEQVLVLAVGILVVSAGLVRSGAAGRALPAVMGASALAAYLTPTGWLMAVALAPFVVALLAVLVVSARRQVRTGTLPGRPARSTLTS